MPIFRKTELKDTPLSLGRDLYLYRGFYVSRFFGVWEHDLHKGVFITPQYAFRSIDSYLS